MNKDNIKVFFKIDGKDVSYKMNEVVPLDIFNKILNSDNYNPNIIISMATDILYQNKVVSVSGRLEFFITNCKIHLRFIKKNKNNFSSLKLFDYAMNNVRNTKSQNVFMSIYDIKNKDIGVRLVGLFHNIHEADNAFLCKKQQYIHSLQVLGVSDKDITNNFVFKKLLF